MNYRHAFHAGSFADVFKHAVLALIIAYLREKPTAFRILDTHAGAGVYDLTGPEASRTGEWLDGIARLWERSRSAEIGDLLAPYLDVVAKFNPDRLVTYPGSPALALALMRPQDRLIACELQPDSASEVAEHLRRDRRAKALTIDGWTALSAYVPPKERRGVVFIDPPFEQSGEFGRLLNGLADAYAKWPTGTYVLWYPIKNNRDSEDFGRRVGRAGIPKILRAELVITPHADAPRLNGSGLIIVNPPWPLERQLAQLLPTLAELLALERRGGARLDWLAREK